MSLIKHNGITYDIDDKLSNKDFTGHDLSLRADLDGKVIYGSCLSNETPNAKVLPTSLIGATFIVCNLDNVLVPDGNHVIDCSVRRFKVQNDGEDWIIDPVTLEPIEPINKATYGKLGLSSDPADLPDEKAKKSVIREEQARLAKIKADAIKVIEDAP